MDGLFAVAARGHASLPLDVLASLTVLAIVPFLLMMCTSFVRIVVVLSLVRSAIGAFALTIFIGARFFRDEWSYGVPLAFGLPAAVAGGVSVFIIVFRKVRAL